MFSLNLYVLVKRSKTCLFGFTFVVAMSTFLLIFEDQRPSIQTLVSETHKQFKSFQDNLKVAEEKRLKIDERYLDLLGFTSSPRLYPSAAWQNTSLPVIVTYMFSGQNMLVIGFIKNVERHLPDHTILIYNLSFQSYYLNTIYNYCNSSSCNVIDYNLNLFPTHVSKESFHAFRPIIIQDALNRAGGVLFLENNLRLRTNNISRLNHAALKPKFKNNQNSTGVLGWSTRRAVSSVSHLKMFEYFRISVDNFFFLRMVDVSSLLLFNTKFVHENIMLPWVQCSLLQDCIAPLGSQPNGCHFDKKPLYRYAGCHAYDASALSIILGLNYLYNESLYTYSSRVPYFYNVTGTAALLEYKQLRENATESSVV